MKCIDVNETDRPVITVEKKGLFRNKITKYQATKVIAGKFHSWVKLPDKTIVPDAMSFQLDEWLSESRVVQHR